MITQEQADKAKEAIEANRKILLEFECQSKKCVVKGCEKTPINYKMTFGQIKCFCCGEHMETFYPSIGNCGDSSEIESGGIGQ